jgi:predicted transglutaminase-like cysteine proteinase
MKFRAIAAGLSFAAALIVGAYAAAVATFPPLPLIDFCQRNHTFCTHRDPESAAADQREIAEKINSLVNEKIVSTPDAHGDHWDIIMPSDSGDYEDYALSKMFLMAWAGIPQGAMRLAVVKAGWLADDQNHVILLIRIGGREYAADNRDGRLRLAQAVSYQWLKISNEGDILFWSFTDGAPQ